MIATGEPNLPPIAVRPNLLAIDDVRVLEGGRAVVTLRRHGSTYNYTDVKVSAKAGTATVGTDFTAPTGLVVTFPPDVLTRTITVDVGFDSVAELLETFQVVLSSPNLNATIEDSTGLVTIIDND
jgi:hypothetical protein